MRKPFEVIDPKDVVFEDRLHCLQRFDPTPEGYPRNDHDPFSPYFYCPYDMRMDIVYRDAIFWLEEFTSGEVGEIREAIRVATEEGREKYVDHARETLPNRPEEQYYWAAQHMYEIRKYELLKMFPPENRTLTTGKVYNEHQLWAVYAIEEIASAVRLLEIPMFSERKKDLAESQYIEDMLNIRLDILAKANMDTRTRPNKHARLVNATYRQRSNMIKAAEHVTHAGQHLQYAMLIVISKSANEREAAQNALKSKQMSGLREIKNLKDSAAERAREIARERWAGDGKGIRIGVMADQVYRQLCSEGFNEQLPDTPDRLRKWIKPVAPEGASRGGRPPKASARNG